MKHTKHLFSAILGLGLVLGSWASARAQGEITLLAPVTAREPIDKIIANFQSKTSYKVKATYVNGVATRQTVAKGGTLDVDLIVAPFPGAIASGTIIPSSQTLIANFVMGVGVPKGAAKPDISSAAAVKKAILAAKWVGYEDPDFTTAGEGPLEMFNRLGIAEQIATKSRVMLGPGGQGVSKTATADATTVYQRLQDGDVDFGILFVSDMIPYKDKFDIVGPLPRKVCPATAMVGFVATHASDPAGAKALLQFLAAAEAQALFKEFGMEPHS